MKTKTELLMKMIDVGIPVHMHQSLLAYITDHRPVGHFLTAVLSNDLREACNRGDDDNKHKLYEYIFFLHNYAPLGCWGSFENVKAWLEKPRQTDAEMTESIKDAEV